MHRTSESLVHTQGLSNLNILKMWETKEKKSDLIFNILILKTHMSDDLGEYSGGSSSCNYVEYNSLCSVVLAQIAESNIF